MSGCAVPWLSALRPHLHASHLCVPAGVVTTLVTEHELPQLEAMASELGIRLGRIVPPPPELLPDAEGAEADLEAARRGLEDLFNLY